jgi:hypothetical protein
MQFPKEGKEILTLGKSTKIINLVKEIPSALSGDAGNKDMVKRQVEKGKEVSVADKGVESNNCASSGTKGDEVRENNVVVGSGPLRGGPNSKPGHDP